MEGGREREAGGGWGIEREREIFIKTISWSHGVDFGSSCCHFRMLMLPFSDAHATTKLSGAHRSPAVVLGNESASLRERERERKRKKEREGGRERERGRENERVYVCVSMYILMCIPALLSQWHRSYNTVARGPSLSDLATQNSAGICFLCDFLCVTKCLLSPPCQHNPKKKYQQTTHYSHF